MFATPVAAPKVPHKQRCRLLLSTGEKRGWEARIHAVHFLASSIPLCEPCSVFFALLWSQRHCMHGAGEAPFLILCQMASFIGHSRWGPGRTDCQGCKQQLKWTEVPRSIRVHGQSVCNVVLMRVHTHITRVKHNTWRAQTRHSAAWY